MRRVLRLMAMLFWLCQMTVAVRAEEKVPDYVKDVAPILKLRCVQCHGPAKREGKLSLALPAAIKRGGENGAAVVSGQPDESLFWQRIAADEMPPEQPLSNDDKTILRRWIEGGAPGLPTEVAPEPDGDEHWSFQALRDVPVPAVRDESKIKSPVDRFIQAKLEAAGLTIGPEANRETLIRRVSFDLTGLPPSVQEIDDFLADQKPNTYERMVERYLNSDRYGERWGKYWLDAAGYADSNGYFGADTDRPLAYRYRDYVLRSINSDKPWNQFLQEQIAGDELAGYRRGGDVRTEMIELLEAVHFLRNSPDGTDSSDGNPDEVRADKYAVLEGTLQILGSSLFGVTVQCARCHDHKFEPFTQRDYYQLQAVIYPAFNVDQWLKPKERDITTASAAEIAAWNEQVKAVDEKIAVRKSAFAEWTKNNRQRGKVLFADEFATGQPLAAAWTNTVPGDEAPSGTPAVQVDTTNRPAAENADGTLRILESGSAGDRALSTKQTFDWTPETPGSWIQVTFDLVAGGETAPYVGYFIGLRDFNDARGFSGGNILFDGAAAGQASVYVDYPGGDSAGKGKVGKSGYTPGRNYGVRVTNAGNGKFDVSQLVDGVPEENSVTLAPADLPDGAFGFEYCCGRSFVIDNVLVEASVPTNELDSEAKLLAEKYQAERQAFEADVKALEATKPQPLGKLAPVSEPAAEPPAVRLLVRGEYKTPGEEVPAAAPVVFSEERNPSLLTSGGRRQALAEWVTRPGSRAAAVLARVTVNRWWQHHFGTGIVATPDNLGYSGAPPSHPELLEYLAGEFIRENWTAKPIHRLILHSAAYRQASRPNTAAQAVDPDNRLLSSYPFRRLDAESIRDAMLAVSGELDPQMYGPYVPTTRSPEGDVVVVDNHAGANRRSVYLQQRRTQVVGMLEAFDAPSITFNCAIRPSTTVPLQSLKLLNSQFLRAQAAAFAKRIRPNAETSDDAALTAAFRTAWGRLPTDAELESSRSFLKTQPAEYTGQPNAAEQTWTDFCQMLLASNAFLYLE